MTDQPQTFVVTGGIHMNTDWDRNEFASVEHYGPFDTYEAAYAEWKSRVWANVDNAQHRLTIKPVDSS